MVRRWRVSIRDHIVCLAVAATANGVLLASVQGHLPSGELPSGRCGWVKRGHITMGWEQLWEHQLLWHIGDQRISQHNSVEGND
jgi:hypothetical protein